MAESGAEGGKQTGNQPIPGYVLTKKLGEGGMAATYLARQTSMNRLVALKIMRRNLARDASFISRFEREAKLAGSLNHVNIVGVHEVSEGGGFHYLAMEYVEGKSAFEEMPDVGGMDEELALHITLQVARGLGFAHKHGISVVNAPGLIDAAYRGEIKVILVNTDPTDDYRVHRGDRIAQLVIQAVEQVEWQVTDSLDGLDRGGGFGHSGR